MLQYSTETEYIIKDFDVELKYNTLLGLHKKLTYFCAIKQ